MLKDCTIGLKFVVIFVIIIIILVVGGTCLGVMIPSTFNSIQIIGEQWAKHISNGISTVVTDYFGTLEEEAVSATTLAQKNNLSLPLDDFRAGRANWTDTWMPFLLRWANKRRFDFSAIGFQFYDYFWIYNAQSYVDDTPQSENSAQLLEWVENLGGYSNPLPSQITVGGFRYNASNNLQIPYTAATNYSHEVFFTPSGVKDYPDDQITNFFKAKLLRRDDVQKARKESSCFYSPLLHTWLPSKKTFWEIYLLCTIMNRSDFILAQNSVGLNVEKQLYKLLQTSPNSPNGETFIMDENGFIIATTRPDRHWTSEEKPYLTPSANVPTGCSTTFQLVAELNPPRLGCLIDWKSYPYPPLNSLSNKFVTTKGNEFQFVEVDADQYPVHKTLQETNTSISGADNTKRSISTNFLYGKFAVSARRLTTKIAQLNLNVITFIPEEDLLIPRVERLMYIAIAGCIVAMICITAVASWLLHLITKRLEEVQRKMMKTAELKTLDPEDRLSSDDDEEDYGAQEEKLGIFYSEDDGQNVNGKNHLSAEERRLRALQRQREMHHGESVDSVEDSADEDDSGNEQQQGRASGSGSNHNAFSSKNSNNHNTSSQAPLPTTPITSGSQNNNNINNRNRRDSVRSSEDDQLDDFGRPRRRSHEESADETIGMFFNESNFRGRPDLIQQQRERREKKLKAKKRRKSNQQQEEEPTRSWIAEVAALEDAYEETRRNLTSFTRYVSRAVVSELIHQRKILLQRAVAERLTNDKLKDEEGFLRIGGGGGNNNNNNNGGSVRNNNTSSMTDGHSQNESSGGTNSPSSQSHQLRKRNKNNSNNDNDSGGRNEDLDDFRRRASINASAAVDAENNMLTMSTYDVSVCLIDIEGFSDIWKNNPDNHDGVCYILHTYFKRTCRLIMGHGGVVDKFIGDSIMCYWGAPTRTEHHALLAVLCSLALLRETRRDPLKKIFNETVGRSLRLRVGIASGTAHVGTVGCTEAVNYSVLGKPTIVATHLQEFNKFWNTHILIEGNCANKIGDTIVLRQLCVALLEGKNLKPVSVYEVIGLDVESRMVREKVIRKRKIMSSHSGVLNATQQQQFSESTFASPQHSGVTNAVAQQNNHNSGYQLHRSSDAVSGAAAAYSAGVDDASYNTMSSHPHAVPGGIDISHNAGAVSSDFADRHNSNPQGSVTSIGSTNSSQQSYNTAITQASSTAPSTTYNYMYVSEDRTIAFSEALSAATLETQGIGELLHALNPEHASVDNLLRWHISRTRVDSLVITRFAELFTEAVREATDLRFKESAALFKSIVKDATIPEQLRKAKPMRVWLDYVQLFTTVSPSKKQLYDGKFIVRK